MQERRLYKRIKNEISVQLKLLGMPRSHTAVDAITGNVSHEGLLIESDVFVHNHGFFLKAGEESISLMPFLILNEKMVDLSMVMPLGGDTIKAIGRVVWYDFTSKGASFHFEVGVLLEEMETTDWEKWNEFVSNVAEKQDKDFRSV